MPSESTSISHPSRSLALLLIANALWFFALMVYSTFIALYIEDLGATPVEVGIFFSVFLTSALIWTGLSGPLTNRFGVKPVLILSWLIIIPGPIIYILAPTWQWTLPGAFIVGAAWLATPPLRTYISHATAGRKRGLGYALLSSSAAISGIPAPTIGGFIITWFGYHHLFMLAIVLFLISTLFILPISHIPRANNTPKPKRLRALLSNKVFRTTALLLLVLTTIETFTSFFLPLYLKDHFTLQETHIGVLTSIQNGSGTLLGPLLSAASDRYGYTKILPLPLTSYYTTLALLIIVPTPALLPPVYAYLGCYQSTYSILNALISHNIQPEQLPNAFALTSAIQRSLTPLTPTLGGITYAINPTLPLATSTLLLPLPLTLALLLHKTNQTTKPQTRKKARSN